MSCKNQPSTFGRIFDALSKLDDFLLNPQVQRYCRTVPVTSWNTDIEKQEPTGDRFHIVSHPEVESSVYQSRISIDSDLDEASHTSLQVGFVLRLRRCASTVALYLF